MKKTSSRYFLAVGFTCVASCGFMQFNEPVFAANISQSTIDLIDRDLKDAKTSRRDFSNEIVELKSTIESKDASTSLKATCYRLLSGIYSGQNKTDEALESIENGAKLDPTNKDIIVQRAFAHSLDADRKNVLEYYNSAIVARPDMDWLYFNRGGLLQGLNRHQDAIKDFDMAISLSKTGGIKSKIAYVLKVNSLMPLSQFKSVVDTAKDVSTQGLPAPLKLDYLKALGYSQLRENQFEEGIKTLTLALDCATNDKEKAIIYHFRAIGYYNSNQKEKAEEDAALAEKHGYRAPGSPPPDKVVKFDQELAEALKPLVVKARSTLPDAKKRFLAGLPARHYMSVTTGLTDKNGRHEQVFVSVESWIGDVVTGKLGNDVRLEGYKKLQELKVNEKDILDWTIVNPKGEEEGNILGKFIEKWLDEHQKSNTVPK